MRSLEFTRESMVKVEKQLKRIYGLVKKIEDDYFTVWVIKSFVGVPSFILFLVLSSVFSNHDSEVSTLRERTGELPHLRVSSLQEECLSS